MFQPFLQFLIKKINKLKNYQNFKENLFLGIEPSLLKNQPLFKSGVANLRPTGRMWPK
jgi:hypothetical protein